MISVVEQGLRSGKCEAHSAIELGEALAGVVETGPPYNILEGGAGRLTDCRDVFEHVTHLCLAGKTVIGKIRVALHSGRQQALLVAWQLLAKKEQIADLHGLRLVAERLGRLAGLDCFSLQFRSRRPGG